MGGNASEIIPGAWISPYLRKLIALAHTPSLSPLLSWHPSTAREKYPSVVDTNGFPKKAEGCLLSLLGLWFPMDSVWFQVGSPFQRRWRRKLLSLIYSVTQTEKPNIFPCSNVRIFRLIWVLYGGNLVEYKENIGILSRAKHDSSVEAILWFESIEVRVFPLICCNLEWNSSKIFTIVR